MTDWKKHPVECDECGAQLLRRLVRPKDGQRILHFFCSRKCKGAWQQAHNKPVGEEWLRQKYLVDRLDCVQIAKMVRRDPKSVWNWLRGYGIETRKRGSYSTAQMSPLMTFAGRHHTDETKAALSRARKGKPIQYKNGGPRWRGVTGPDHPSWKGGATPERQAFYSSNEWVKAQRWTYARAGGKCERCGSRTDLHIHHVIPFAFPKVRACPANLRVLCAPCHRFVHSKRNEDREFLPPFGIMYLTTSDGQQRKIRINYNPKHKARLPSWL